MTATIVQKSFESKHFLIRFPMDAPVIGVAISIRCRVDKMSNEPFVVLTLRQPDGQMLDVRSENLGDAKLLEGSVMKAHLYAVVQHSVSQAPTCYGERNPVVPTEVEFLVDSVIGEPESLAGGALLVPEAANQLATADAIFEQIAREMKLEVEVLESPQDAWDCEDARNPLGRCVYNAIDDHLMDECLYCGQPEERK